MADRYWRGGTGTWATSGTTNWSSTDGGGSGASVPTSADAVYITPNSGTGTITLTGVLVCASLNITATQAITVTSTGVLSVYGDILVPSNITWTATGNITQRGAGGFFTFVPIAPSIIWSNATAYTLQANLTLRLATGTCTLQNGDLDLNGYNITCGQFNITGLSYKGLYFGNNFIYLVNTTVGATVLSFGDATNFYCQGSGGFSTIMSVTRTITCATSNSFNGTVPNLFITSGASIPTITTGSSFNKIDFTGSTCTPAATSVKLNNLTLASGGTYTGLTVTMFGGGTITSVAKTIAALTINHVSTTTLADALTIAATGTTTLTAGTLALAGFTLTTGIFASTNVNGRSITFGAGNIVLAHTSIAQTVLSMAIATGFSYTGTGGFTSAMSVTRTFVFGTTGGSTTNAPNLSLTSGASTTTFTASSWFNLLDFTGHTGSIPSTRINVNSLKLGGGGYGSLDVVMAGTGNITSVGKSLANITISHTGVTTLLDAFTQGVDQTPLYMQTGTLDLGGFTCTISIFNNFGTGTRAIAFGSTNIVLARSTAGVVINSSVVTNFSWTGTGGFTTAMSVDRSFAFNNSSYVVVDNAPNLWLTSGAGIPSFNNVNRGSWFKNLNFTGSTSTVAGDANSARLTVYVQGLTLASGGNYDKLRPSMYGTGTINTAGNSTLGGLIIDHVDNSATITTLTSAVTLPTTSNTTLTSGTLDLGGNNLSTGDFISTGSGTRAIAFNTSNIILTFSYAVGTVLNMADATNFSTTGAGGFTSTAATLRYYNFGSTSGGTANNAPNLSITSGGSQSGFVINSYFNHLNFTGSTTVPRDSLSVSAFAVNLKALTLASGVSYTYLTPTIVGGGGAINSAGNSTLPSLTINHSSGSEGNTTLAANLTLATNATTTLTSGNLVLAGFTLDNGIFNASGSTPRVVHFGTGNIALTHTTGSTTVLNVADATNFTLTGTGRFTSAMSVARTFTFGTTGGTSTNAPNLSLTSGTAVPTFTTGSWFNSLNFTGTTSTPV